MNGGRQSPDLPENIIHIEREKSEMSSYLYHSDLCGGRLNTLPSSLWNGRFERSDGPLATLENRPCREIHELCRDICDRQPSRSSRVAS